ncbi:hypothetical protein [Spirosoma montaniterrae]|uniref:Secretion system C-terminal sorting domain-containing protein n=1 Tax=Spirosoma montaniterrae TaxID=1178516 RepID=A0A1P9WUD7_9BACT|nr:hypothetical protein [Spirosoma montaniterrae]AQG78979.1 hypothetical protein AWR27_06340 [Spirosoma montaniterrae]
MKMVCLLLVALSGFSPVLGQEIGHYDLLSVNEVVRGEGFTVTITSTKAQTLDVTVEKPVRVLSVISIRSANRQLLCSEQANRLDGGYRRLFNLAHLESGRYWLEIRVGKARIWRELRLESIVQPSFRTLTMK